MNQGYRAPVGTKPPHKIKMAFGLFVACVLFYGAFLEPTPENIGFLYALFVAAFGTCAALSIGTVLKPTWYLAAFFFSFSVGLTVATVRSNDTIDVVRDLIALSFLFIVPSIIWRFRYRRLADLLTIAMATAGAFLSVRFVLRAENGFSNLLHQNIRPDFSYLSSEPLVMFAPLAFTRLFFSTRLPIHWRLAAAAAAAISLVGLIASTYRGPLIVVFLYGIWCAAFSTLRVKLTAIPLGLAGLWFARNEIFLIYEKVARKFEAVGDNSKLSEALGIFGREVSWTEFLFGNGLGGQITLTWADAGLNYAHNFFSYTYAKFGALVFVALLILCFRLAREYRIILRHDLLPEALTLAYIGMMQGAYKHFGFGLILGLLVLRIRIERRAFTAAPNTDMRYRRGKISRKRPVFSAR